MDVLLNQTNQKFLNITQLMMWTDLMVGAIDIHSHIAGGNVNNVRLLSPEIHSKFVEQNLNRKKKFAGF